MNHSMQVMSSSNDMTWETPRYFFDFLDRKYRFQLDPCCVPATAKCERFYTPADDGLAQDWNGLRVFMNPPLGRMLQSILEFQQAICQDQSLSSLSSQSKQEALTTGALRAAPVA